MAKVRVYINWEQNFISTDFDETLQKIMQDDNPFCEWLSENYPEKDEDSATDAMKDEYIDDCVDYLDTETNGWAYRDLDISEIL